MGVPERVPQAVRVETSRRKLLQAAAELFVERGYHATSAGDIAARAGYSREMVRVRFGSKLALARELLSVEYGDRLYLDSDPNIPAIEMLNRRIDRLVEMGEIDGLSVRAAFVLGFESVISVPELETQFTTWLAEAERRFADDVERAMAEGSIRELDPQEAARLLMAAGSGGAYNALRTGNPNEAADALRSALNLLRVAPSVSGSRARRGSSAVKLHE